MAGRRISNIDRGFVDVDTAVISRDGHGLPQGRRAGNPQLNIRGCGMRLRYNTRYRGYHQQRENGFHAQDHSEILSEDFGRLCGMNAGWRPT